MILLFYANMRALHKELSFKLRREDGQDDHDADEIRGGPNGLLSLTQVRRNFGLFGASDQKFASKVRPPLPDEL